MLSIQNKENATRVAFAAIIAGLALLLLGSQVYARISSPRGDNVVASEDAVDNVLARVVVAAETTATSTSLVDLSDTTNFPHNPGNSIEVSKIIVNWSTDVIATTTLKFGVIASSTPSGANVDVYWFDEVSFSSTNPTGLTEFGRQEKVLDYSPSLVRLDLASGKPNSFLANDSNLYTTAFATTTSLLSPNGYVNLGVGDLVMQVDQKGTATTSASAIYRVRE